MLSELFSFLQGYIRFEEEGGASKALDGMKAAVTEDETPQLCGDEVELRVLEGTIVKLRNSG